MILSRRFIWSLLTAGAVSACAVSEPRLGEGVVQQAQVGLDRFDLTARFNLQLEPRQEGEVRQYAGRLQWQHGATGDRLLFLDPMGQGVAELLRPDNGQAVLLLADGTRREADDPEQLLGDVLGTSLPLKEMTGWVQARPGQGALVELDALGRPRMVRESGWFLSYRYGEEARLPSHIDASLSGVLKFRLFVENWEVLP